MRPGGSTSLAARRTRIVLTAWPNASQPRRTHNRHGSSLPRANSSPPGCLIFSLRLRSGLKTRRGRFGARHLDKALEARARPATVYRLAGVLPGPVRGRSLHPRRREQPQRSAARCLGAAPTRRRAHPSRLAALTAGSPPFSSERPGTWQAERHGVDDKAAGAALSGAPLDDRRWRGGGQFVQAVMAVHNPGPLRPSRSEDRRQSLSHAAVTHPNQLIAHPAGLASGPRRLNAVGTPSSRRVGITWRMAGWYRGAKQNPIPTSSIQRATEAGGRAICTPRASSTSAEPVREEAARPPCLQTGTPAPATTRAAIVETLIVPAWSPPVPQVSTSRLPSSAGTGTLSATSSMASNMPVSSSEVSPLQRKPKMNAATCDGVAAPSRISRSAAPDCAALRSWLADNRPNTAGQPPISARAGRCGASTRLANESSLFTASGTPQRY